VLTNHYVLKNSDQTALNCSELTVLLSKRLLFRIWKMENYTTKKDGVLLLKVRFIFAS